MSSDITARHAAARSEVEERNALADLLSDALYIIAEGRFVFVNNATLALFGATCKEELVGREIREFIHPDEFVRFDARVAMLESGQDMPRSETKFLRLDGSSVDVEAAWSRHRFQGRPAVNVVARDISERIRSQEMTSRFRAAMDLSDDAIFLTDCSTIRFVDVNETACRMYGYSREELLRMGPHDLQDARSREALEQDFRDPAGVFGNFQSLARRRDGTHFPVEITRRLLDSRLGRLSIATVRDVTESLIAEEALRESAERFRAVFTGAGVGILLLDARGHIVEANLAAQRVIGYGGESLRGRLPTEFSHPEDVAEVQQRFSDLIHGKADRVQFEKRFVREPGPMTWARVTGTVVRDAAGGPKLVVAMVEDVSERKLSEDALFRREQEFRALAENSPDLIVRFDRDVRIVYANPVIGRLTGIPPADYIGRTSADMGMVEPLLSEWNGVLRGVFETGLEATYEAMLPARGRMRFFQSRIVPESTKEGEIGSVLVVARDISDLRGAEQVLRELSAHHESVREDERASIAREIHDELGQSLTALKMDLSMLNLRFGNTVPALGEGLQALKAMVDNTIQVVRGVATTLRPAALDLGIQAAVEWLAQEFQRRSRIRCTLTVTNEEIEIDEGRAIVLFRILQESLTNIARHSQASLVEIALGIEGQGIRLVVRDNGKGFDPKAVRDKKSFGLLGIRERVMMLGGRVFFDSAPGKGVIVSVSIPC